LLSAEQQAVATLRAEQAALTGIEGREPGTGLERLPR
jgi:hypothetical protein